MDQVYLYFLYGLAFFTMGVAVFTRVFGVNASLGIRDLQWIAYFGLLHGINEWLVMFSLLERNPSILGWEEGARELANAASYIALVIGSVRLLGGSVWRRSGVLLVTVWGFAMAGLGITEAPSGEFDVATRVLLGSPAAFLAAMAFLRLQAGPSSSQAIVEQERLVFRVVAAAFGVYGVFTLIAQPSALFPATYFNTAWFVGFTGVDVAWFRAAIAGAIALALLIAVRLISEDRLENLKRREERLTDVLDNSPLGVSIFSSDPFERLYVNRTFKEMVGHELDSQKEAAGVETFVDPEDFHRMAGDLARGIERNNFVAQRIRPSTGETWWSAVSTRNITFAGRDAALVWVMDISELKAREEQLAANAGQLREILESCSTAVCIFRKDSDRREYIYASNRMLEMFGANDLEALNAFGFLNTFADRDVALRMRDRHRDGKFGSGEVYERVRLDGSHFWVMGSAREIEFEGAPAVIAWIADITSSVHERRQIEENAEQLRRILEISRSGVTIFHADTNERYFATSRALEQFGYETLEALNETNFRETFVREVDAAAAMNAVQNGRGPRHYTFERRRPDGSTWWSLVDIDEIDFEGMPSKIAWHHDVSEQKRVEADLRETVDVLRRTQEELVEAEKMASLGGLIAGVSHEINTPVGICITAASALDHEITVLRRGYEEGKLTRGRFTSILDKLSSAADLVSRNALRAGELISSFKRVAVDQTSDQQRRFMLLDYIEDVLVSLGPELSRRRTVYELKGDRNIALTGYPGAISQIVTNLAMNAAIHAYGDGPGGKIEISCEEAGPDDVVMIFRDFGKGMEPETVRRVFDPFFTTRRGQGGTGLGMHILYNLVSQRLGGRVVCHSEPGVGTTVELRFPKVAADPVLSDRQGQRLSR